MMAFVLVRTGEEVLDENWQVYMALAQCRYFQLDCAEFAGQVFEQLTRADLLRISGMTEAQLQHCERVAGIAAAGEDWWRLMRTEQERRKATVEKAVVRQLHRMATGNR